MDGPHVRVAMTTNNLVQVDANFVAAKQMVFYDVSREAAEFVEAVAFSRFGKKGPGGGIAKNGRCVMEDMGNDDGTGHDPITERVDAVRGSSLLVTVSMSDLAAVRVHKEAVFPVKSGAVRDIDDVLANVQRMLSGNPPLWLRRVMRDAAGKRMDLDRQEL